MKEVMKILAQKVIIYDDVCPMCKAYTNGFVQLGWLPIENRLGFSEAPHDILTKIDQNRARHEIPLYDKVTGETLYGKDALFYILGEQMPVLKPLFRFFLFRAFILALYQIITYNRRIIAGSQKPKTGFDCAPDFNTFYRWLYILLAGAGFLHYFFTHILIFNNECFTLIFIIFVGILRGVFFSDFQKQTDYFGHLVTVLLIVQLLFVVFGVHYYTLNILPLLGVYFFTKRLNLIEK